MSSHERQAPPPTRLLDRFFAIDLRSLALFRIALASVLFYDLIDRARDMRDHYTDLGLLPAELLEQIGSRGIRFSLHYYLSSSEWAILGLFAIAWLAATALLVGHRTRIATFVSWVLLSSLQLRNPYLASMGGDQLLRILLFWALLLPLGARFSLDAARDPLAPEGENRLRSFPAAGLLVQVCLVYWVTGLKKNGATWLDGSAVYYALHLDYWATPIGVAVREQTWLLPLLTHATRWFELLGPFLAFSPIWTAQLRLVTFICFAFFHASLALCLDIGMFPLVSMVGWFAFIPAWFWDELLPHLFAGRSREDESGFDREEFDDAEEDEDDEDEQEEEGEDEDDEGHALRPGRRLTPWPAQLVAIAVLFYITTSLAAQLGFIRNPTPRPVAQVFQALRVAQSWSMFSPDPTAVDFWPVVTGTLPDGDSIDLFRAAPPDFAKPEQIRKTLPSFRWRLYFSSLFSLKPDDPRFEPSHAGLVRYLCRAWNETHDGAQQIHDVHETMVIEFTRPDFEELGGQFPIYEGACETEVPGS